MSEVGGVRLCCLLWAVTGQESGLHAYEDEVLGLVAEHDGEVVVREFGDGRAGSPHEVQVLVFGDQGGVDGYLADSRRTALAGRRDQVVARTELFPVRLPDADGGRL